MKQPFYAVNKIVQVSARILVLKLPFHNKNGCRTVHQRFFVLGNFFHSVYSKVFIQRSCKIGFMFGFKVLFWFKKIR